METKFGWPSGTHIFHQEIAGYGPLQSSHHEDHHEIAGYGTGYGWDHYEISGTSEFSSMIQSSDRPMRGWDLIM